MMKGQRDDPSSGPGGSRTGELSGLGPGKRTRVESLDSPPPSPTTRDPDTRPAKIPRNAVTSTTGGLTGGNLVDYDSDSDSDRSRSPSPERSRSDAEREDSPEREERGGAAPELGLPKSTPQQQANALAAVDAIQPYGDDWDAAREQILGDLARLRPLLTPVNADGGQWMWHDDDEILTILARGFQTIQKHIEHNEQLNQMFTRHPGLLVGGGVGPLNNVRATETFLGFLTAASYECAQATDGALDEWIRRIRDAKS